MSSGASSEQSKASSNYTAPEASNAYFECEEDWEAGKSWWIAFYLHWWETWPLPLLSLECTNKHVFTWPSNGFVSSLDDALSRSKVVKVQQPKPQPALQQRQARANVDNFRPTAVNVSNFQPRSANVGDFRPEPANVNNVMPAATPVPATAPGRGKLLGQGQPVGVNKTQAPAGRGLSAFGRGATVSTASSTPGFGIGRGGVSLPVDSRPGPKAPAQSSRLAAAIPGLNKGPRGVNVSAGFSPVGASAPGSRDPGNPGEFFSPLLEPAPYSSLSLSSCCN